MASFGSKPRTAFLTQHQEALMNDQQPNKQQPDEQKPKEEEPDRKTDESLDPAEVSHDGTHHAKGLVPPRHKG
jgi:hypothetical protein